MISASIVHFMQSITMLGSLLILSRMISYTYVSEYGDSGMESHAFDSYQMRVHKAWLVICGMFVMLGGLIATGVFYSLTGNWLAFALWLLWYLTTDDGFYQGPLANFITGKSRRPRNR